MIESSSSWISQRESTWQPHSFNYLTENAATLQPEHMPTCVHSHHVSAHMNGYNVCGMPADRGVKIKDQGWFEQNRLFFNISSSLPTMNTYPNKHQLAFPSGNDWKETPYESSYPQQKKFLIFDRSGEDTRMVLSSLCSPICNGAAVNAFKSEKSCPKLPDLSEDSGENHLVGEGSDYHEDTEEINALLYSSDDDVHDHVDEDEISTGRSPNAVDDGFENTEEGEDFDEVSSFWCSSKRQKLLEGSSYSKLSAMASKAMSKSATQLNEDESVVNPSLSWKRKRMHKIHDTLRVLQKLIPDSKTQDPLVIIDETISYLKSLKDKSLHMEKADGSSWSTPFQ